MHAFQNICFTQLNNKWTIIQESAPGHSRDLARANRARPINTTEKPTRVDRTSREPYNRLETTIICGAYESMLPFIKGSLAFALGLWASCAEWAAAQTPQCAALVMTRELKQLRQELRERELDKNKRNKTSTLNLLLIVKSANSAAIRVRYPWAFARLTITFKNTNPAPWLYNIN